MAYVKIRFTQFIIYKHIQKCVIVIVSCLHSICICHIECDNSVVCRPSITDYIVQKKILNDFSLKLHNYTNYVISND